MWANITMATCPRSTLAASSLGRIRSSRNEAIGPGWTLKEWGREGGGGGR